MRARVRVWIDGFDADGGARVLDCVHARALRNERHGPLRRLASNLAWTIQVAATLGTALADWTSWPTGRALTRRAARRLPRPRLACGEAVRRHNVVVRIAAA